MAKMTCKGLTYAKITSGGNGSPMVYTGGKMLRDYLCNVELTENRENVKDHADGHQIDGENKLISVSLLLELAAMNADIEGDILGHKTSGTGGNGEMNVTDADAPFVGIGYMLQDRFKGVNTFSAYWVYKIQMSSQGNGSPTSKEQAQFNHDTVSGDGVGVQLTEGGDILFYSYKDGMANESDADAWLKSKAGITN